MKYDLEQRTASFAIAVRQFIKQLPQTISNAEDAKQLARSSGSVGANYREANESVSRKDLLHRMKTARKVAKETIYWLTIIDADKQKLDRTRGELIQEARELVSILATIIKKFE